MPTFRIEATETVRYELLVEADTIEDAVEAVLEGDETDMHEVDSSGLTVTEYTVDGQMGWHEWEGGEPAASPDAVVTALMQAWYIRDLTQQDFDQARAQLRGEQV